jgi:hydrogenase maturation protease
MDGAMAIPLRTTSCEVLVLGLGNTLLGDDGVGVHVARRLASQPDAPAGLRPVDGGTLGFRLMDLFARSNAMLLVDAAHLNAPPGTVRLLDHEALERHIRRNGRLSAHEAGLAAMLTLVELEGCVPARLALLGIQPKTIDWSDTLSHPVAQALDVACRVAIETVCEWQRST